MNKRIQQAAVNSGFKRNEKDDWEIIASEQYDENKRLTGKLVELEEALNKNKDIILIDPKKCRNWKYSDRNDFEMGDIEELAEDIRLNGQLQPAIIRKIDDLNFEFEIIAGERRWRACLLANINLTAIITDKDDTECMVIQTSENKKKNLSPYSLAKVYERLMTDNGISQNELSKKLGIPKSSFGDLMSFNKVPSEVWSAVGDMSNVKPRTAAYLAITCNKSEEHKNAVLKVATKIKDGVGVDNLEKAIEKFISNTKVKRNSSIAYENKNGELLFRITSEGRISLAKTVLRKIDLQELSQIISGYLERTI